MTHKVPNISIFGNKCPTIPISHSGCVLHRKIQGSCRGPTWPPRATGSSKVFEGIWPQFYGFKIEKMYPARHKMGVDMYQGYGSPWTVVVSVMESRIWRATNSCIDGAKVGQNFFSPVRTSDPTYRSLGPPTKGDVVFVHLLSRLISSASRQLIFDHCPFVFGFWLKSPSIKSLGVRPRWPCFIAKV